MIPSRKLRLVSKLLVLLALLASLGFIASSTVAAPPCDGCEDRFDRCIANGHPLAICQRLVDRCFDVCI